MHFTHVFDPSFPLNELTSIPVFVLTSGMAIYLVLMAYIVLCVLNEVRPLWFYVLGGVLFVLSQLDYFFSEQGYLQGCKREDRRELCGDDMGDGGFGRAVPRMAEYHRRIVGRRVPCTPQERTRKGTRRNEDGGDPEVEMTNTKRSRRGLEYGLNDWCDVTHAM
ncbi:hypothetical protein FIBSPDRAFT_545614 [Athelia psychrophila]|uniref:Uncharacterized protein n=1 Tax=Athelia psychrophila TaxID=1759441 RepID=A0A166IW46_9AGAM|nr:hypothetical protein FIBSPDRAFT_545614 [Fibularhizoctonia sp. CBS 109695]